MIKHYIDGKWIESIGQGRVPIINPATEEVLDYTPLGGKDDVDRAVEAASRAFVGWKKVPAVDRVQFLFKLKGKLELHLEEIAGLITKEHGKTLAESIGSVKRGIQMLDTACGIPSLMLGDNFEDIARGIDSSTVRRPLGVFACIAPFNFPAMVPFWFWPFAIAAGNTYVLKASERVPLTSIRIFELLEEVGLPAGVMNLVHGGVDTVNSICSHPEIKGVSFVGSTPVAKHVYELSSQHGKRVQALGGAKNLMLAMPDSMEGEHENRTVAMAVESITGCAGERCLAGSLVLCVGQDCYQKFKTKSVELAKEMVVGPGDQEGVSMGPLISQEAKDRVVALIDKAIEQGAELLLDGRLPKRETGYFLEPTVLAGITPEMEIAQTEVFGPVVLLSSVDSLDAGISWINQLPYANTTTIFTNLGGVARRFVSEVHPSMIGVNIGVPAPMAFFSFGGSKDSFFGDVKAHGKESIQFFTDTYTTIYRWYSDSSIW